MKHASLQTNFFLKHWNKIYFIIIVSLLMISGCTGYGKPQYNVDKYLLSYKASSWDKRDTLATSVKFSRFSIAAAYNSTNMVFRSDAYSLDSFNYSRWAVNPADMIADSLLSDIRGSGLFQAVFSRYDGDEGRFLISGGIEDFYLLTDTSNKKVVITMSISLKDTREKETGKSLLFQKKYSREEPLQESSPRGYCQAASQAMQVLSQKITNDIYTKIKTTLNQDTNQP